MALQTGRRAPALTSSATLPLPKPARAGAWRTRAGLTAGLLAVDALAVCAAFAAAYIIRFRSEWSIFYAHSDEPLRFYSSLVFLLAPMILLVFAGYRLYSLSDLFDGPGEYSRIASAATLAMLGIVLLSFFVDGDLVISRGWILISWAALIVFVGAGRFMTRRVVYALRRRGVLGRRVALIAGRDDLADLETRVAAMPASGLNVVEVLQPEQLISDGLDDAPVDLQALLAAHQVTDVVVSAASVPQAVLARVVRELAQQPTQLHVVPGMYEIQTTGVQVREIHGLPLVTMNKVRITGVDFVLKRTLDYLVAGLALILLAPLLLAMAAAVKLTSPGPVLHRRRVIGERGQRFDALKFRTMYVNGAAILAEHPELQEALAKHGKLVEDPRVTPIGGWLRRWSIDELPQLLNVLRGQMSLVGPRMITADELDHFGHWRDNLLTVKPGLTGLWQVSGRSRLGYDERVRLDMYYIRSYTIWQDLEILLRTIPAVLRGVGAY
jgi:exopolysaccharide biosynthesis polyprenyl glycosylphosphotransferase